MLFLYYLSLFHAKQLALNYMYGMHRMGVYLFDVRVKFVKCVLRVKVKSYAAIIITRKQKQRTRISSERAKKPHFCFCKVYVTACSLCQGAQTSRNKISHAFLIWVWCVL